MDIYEKKSEFILKVLREQKRWEDIPNRREPVTKEMIEERIALTRSKILESDEEDASVLGDDVSQLLIYLSGKIFLTHE